MDNHITPFGWKRNLEYFKTNFKLMWINTIEYKANFYGNILTLFSFTLIQLFTYSLISYVFSDLIGWKFSDFILFYVLMYLVGQFNGIFSWGKELFIILSKGTLNIYLTKPIKPFIGYIFSILSGYAFISIIFRTILLFLVIYYFNITLNNLLLGLVLFLSIGFLFFLIYQFIESCEFISLNLSSVLDTYWQIDNIFTTYPAQLFRKFPFQFALYFFPLIFISSLIVPLLRGYEIWNLYSQLTILISLIIIFGFGTWLNWHYGLKKYEAFG